MSENLLLALASIVINGAVTWGVVSTKLAWMRRDLDDHHTRLQWLERREAA
jgi:hypothetical protein